MPYAEGTSVPASRSLDELQRLLVRHGARQYAQGWDSNGHRIMFELGGRAYRFDLAATSAAEMSKTPTGRARNRSTAQQLAEQESARRMRSLVLVIKALLVGVEDGITDIGTALLPWTVLPDGSTVGQWAGPQITAAYEGRTMPALMPGSG